VPAIIAETEEQLGWRQTSPLPIQPTEALPPPKKHIADRDRRNFKAEDWTELNEWLEKMGSPVRYRMDGTKTDSAHQPAAPAR
jgi:hypothetical protein